MAKRHKVRKSLLSMILLWIGRRLITRVQRKTMKSITHRASNVGRVAASPVVQDAASKAIKRAAKHLPRRGTAEVSSKPAPLKRSSKGKGIALTLMSAAAVAALKYGVDKVVEAERNEHVVTPDFDVFNDDEN